MSDDTMSDDTRSEPPISVEESGPSPTAAAPRGAPADLPTDLLRSAADPLLTEDLALALLKRADLPPEVLEQLARNANALKSRKVKIALVSHPHTPRHVSVPLARQFYTFDLMKVALSPVVPADVKVAVDDVLISRLKAVTVGERLTLARRASGRVAAALLLDSENAGAKIVDAVADGKIARWQDLRCKDKRSSHHRRQDCGPREPSHAGRTRQPATYRSARYQFCAPPRRQRRSGASGCPAREVVVPQRNPRRPSSNRASFAGARPGIQPGNPRSRCCKKCSPVRVSQKRSKTNYSESSHRDHGALRRFRPSRECIVVCDFTSAI
jgi:hypothetical protein